MRKEHQKEINEGKPLGWYEEQRKNSINQKIKNRTHQLSNCENCKLEFLTKIKSKIDQTNYLCKNCRKTHKIAECKLCENNLFLVEINSNDIYCIECEKIPICNCGKKMILRTVKKEGKNKGRQFYGCNYGSSGCNAFEWV